MPPEVAKKLGVTPGDFVYIEVTKEGKVVIYKLPAHDE